MHADCAHLETLRTKRDIIPELDALPYPWTLFVRLQQPFTAGLHKWGALWVYTSRGTGYWGPPKRFGAPSEITCLRLVAA